jgi:hypothetical protein
MNRQLLLLGLLRREEMHGYHINEFIEEKMHRCIDLKKWLCFLVVGAFAPFGVWFALRFFRRSVQ